MVTLLLAFLLLLAVVFVVSAPLRRRDPERGLERQAERVANLEAAREAKYHEIRDAELDMSTGKLREEDFDQLNTSLRAEAVAILTELEAARRGDGGVATTRGA